MGKKRVTIPKEEEKRSRCDAIKVNFKEGVFCVGMARFSPDKQTFEEAVVYEMEIGLAELLVDSIVHRASEYRSKFGKGFDVLNGIKGEKE